MATEKPVTPELVDDIPLPPRVPAFPDEPPTGAKPPREDPAPISAGDSVTPDPPSSVGNQPTSNQPTSNQLDPEKALSFIEDIIDTLTFKRIALIALLSVIGLVFYVLYENRTAIVNMLVRPDSALENPNVTSWVLSENSKASLQNLAKMAVLFIAVTDADLKQNRRIVRYYYLDSAIKPGPEALKILTVPQAVFDYDPKNTAQMVAILGNEFRCDPFRDTIYFRYAPEFENRIPTICRLAIPPFVGQFVGFITVGTSKEMTKQELDSIRLEVSRIATEIYLNDVIMKPTS